MLRFLPGPSISFREMVRHEGIGRNEAGSICGKRRVEGGPVPFVLSLPNDPLAEASTIGISRAAQFQFRFSTGNRID